jgi:hypothetical protein
MSLLVLRQWKHINRIATIRHAPGVGVACNLGTPTSRFSQLKDERNKFFEVLNEIKMGMLLNFTDFDFLSAILQNKISR